MPDQEKGKPSDKGWFASLEEFEADRALKGITGAYSPNIPRMVDMSTILSKFDREPLTPTADDVVIFICSANAGEKQNVPNIERGGHSTQIMHVLGNAAQIEKALTYFLKRNPVMLEVFRRAYMRAQAGDMFDFLDKILSR